MSIFNLSIVHPITIYTFFLFDGKSLYIFIMDHITIKSENISFPSKSVNGNLSPVTKLNNISPFCIKLNNIEQFRQIINWGVMNCCDSCKININHSGTKQWISTTKIAHINWITLQNYFAYSLLVDNAILEDAHFVDIPSSVLFKHKKKLFTRIYKIAQYSRICFGSTALHKFQTFTKTLSHWDSLVILLNKYSSQHNCGQCNHLKRIQQQQHIHVQQRLCINEHKLIDYIQQRIDIQLEILKDFMIFLNDNAQENELKFYNSDNKSTKKRKAQQIIDDNPIKKQKF